MWVPAGLFDDSGHEWIPAAYQDGLLPPCVVRLGVYDT